jgi:subfamily B ATP-binding cassette protein HlyB/CyaB
VRFSLIQLLKAIFVSPQATPALAAGNPDTVLWVLSVLCGMHAAPFDAVLARPKVEATRDWGVLQEIGQELSLDVAAARSQDALKKAKDESFVCFAAATGTANSTAPAGLAEQPVLVLQSDETRVLVLFQGGSEPTVLSHAEFLKTVLPFAFSVTRKWAKGEERPLPFGYGWLFREMKKYKAVWRDVLIGSLVIQIVSLLTPLLTQTVIDKVITNHTQSTLVVLTSGLLMLTLFSAALGWVRQYLVLHTGNRVDAFLGSKVFGHLTQLPLGYFETRPTGTLVTRLHGVETLREFITGTFVTVVLDLPFMLVFLALMAYYSPLLTGITVGVTLVMTALSFMIAPVLREKVNSQFMSGAKIQSFATEYIAGMETVKSLQMEHQVEARYSEYMGEYMYKGFDARQLSNTYNALMNGLDQTASLAILAAGAWMAMQETGFTIGMLVAFQMFSGKVTQPLLRLSGLWQQFQQANISLKRLSDIMDVPVEQYSLVPSSVRSAAPKLEVRGLSFSYASDRQPLYDNLNFSIEPGQCVAIVGPSGCGKSTIAKLLQGFYPSYKGQILVGGRELRTVAVNELRTWFGVVPQDTTLFSGSIADNLHAANPKATLEHMAQACKWAGVHDAIEGLPRGYLTEIGERGVGLSGGQKQRLAIARALLKGARVLIFDESTANLDPLSAQAVAETVNKLKGQLTILFVAHHLPPNLRVDRTILLPKGHDIQVPGASRGTA